MNERGQALVEFALVLPFLLLFALAIVLIAEIGVARLALEHAAAEGARVGSLTNDDEEIVGRSSPASTTHHGPATHGARSCGSPSSTRSRCRSRSRVSRA